VEALQCWGTNFAKVNAQAMFNEVDVDGNKLSRRLRPVNVPTPARRPVTVARAVASWCSGVLCCMVVTWLIIAMYDSAMIVRYLAVGSRLYDPRKLYRCQSVVSTRNTRSGT